MSSKNNWKTEKQSCAPGRNTQYMNLSVNKTDVGKAEGLSN